MPESSGSPAKTPKNSGNPANRREAKGRPEPKKQQVGNPSWWVPTMSALMIAGVIWVATFYISEGLYPLTIGYWNLAIGMGLIMAGFFMTTKWK
ncbi:cell division protein CrgA [Ornithinimicrobium sp. INDO-MA30-4]|uniref:cell division protein CrgA n=1 Tax=Ornithinimicrobium sp. INDO-MA30-4 TaxID=2908651 RepID=UPI001F23560A|nr:cell division protein CrgA [Ornithinimicrobium sp. INDO-MA30-4]UJH70019.1 cell division protein CrgA [Ornithinimicrobium sp. INDO-MA30-4]